MFGIVLEGKTDFVAVLHDLSDIWGYSRDGKIRFYSQINMILTHNYHISSVIRLFFFPS